MAKLSEAAIERKQKQKQDIEKQITEYQNSMHALRTSDESRLAKTHKLKQYQQKITSLKHQLGSIE